jgi:hypothetical protein
MDRPQLALRILALAVLGLAVATAFAALAHVLT